MRTIRLTLAYDGSRYVGWQTQPNGLAVQAVVEQAIRQLTGESVRVNAAGRTDSGVHALGQVASFLTETRIPCENLRAGLQNFLPSEIVVREAAEVPESFHATYSAKAKRYRYVIHNAPVCSPFLTAYVWHFRRPLDVAAMHDAAQALVGTHDFRSFETDYPNRASSVRTVTELTVNRYAGWPVWTQQHSLAQPPEPDGSFICFDIVADGFLYNMVRAIVGTLVHVGRGKWPTDSVQRILEAQDRTQAGDTAPPHGLYLVHVYY